MSTRYPQRARAARARVKVAAFDGAPWLFMLASAFGFSLWQLLAG
ncbi:hypothetical protein [Oleidesulfovibrio alaskensis]|nr:hypothetical protein [Oleidesulfovibrio alaskensis]